MKLRARDQKKASQEPEQAKSDTKEISAQVEEKKQAYTELIQIQVNTLLYDTLQNMVNVSITGQDFSFTSVTDFIRAALEAYKNGMKLIEQDQPGDRKQTSMRVTKELHEFYKTIPNRLKRTVLERAIRTFIKNLN
jgi:hypothetical protein